jgi:hypothetical protein
MMKNTIQNQCIGLIELMGLTSHQKSILRDGIQHGKAPREIRRDVNTAIPADIILSRVAQNARYYQHKKDRPEST